MRCPKKLDFWGTLKVMGIEKYSLICYYIYRIEELGEVRKGRNANKRDRFKFCVNSKN